MQKKLQRKNEEFIQTGADEHQHFKVTPKRFPQFKVTNLLNQQSNDGLDIGGGEVNVSFTRDNIKIVEY